MATRFRSCIPVLALTGLSLITACKEVSVTTEDVATVEIQPPTLDLQVGQSANLQAIVKGVSGRELRRSVQWTSSNAGIASVSNSGVVTGEAPGSARITASVDGKSDEVTVNVGARSVASVEVSPPSTSLAVGDSALFLATARAGDGTPILGKVPSWSSSAPGIAVVRPGGWVVGLSVGNAMIRAQIDGVTGQSEVAVRAAVLAVSNVRIEPPSPRIGVGDTLRLRAIATAVDGGIVSGRQTLWSSSNPSIAEVDGTGKVTGRSVGQTTITANVDGVNGQTVMEVTPAVVASVEISPGRATVALGGTTQLQAILRSALGAVITGPTVTWSSNNNTVATVNNNGLVTGNAVGQATITATASGISATATITVVPQPVSTIAILPAQPLVHVADTILLTADLRDASGAPVTGRAVSWTSVDTAIAVVQPTGPATQQARLIGRRPGSVRIAAAAESKTDTVTAVVDPRAGIVVTKTAPSALVKAGDTINFTLTVRNDGPSAAANVVLTDTLPGNAQFVSATGNPTLAGNVLTWATVASMPANTSSAFTVRIIAPASGGVTNIGAATTTTFEHNITNNRAVAAVSVSPADLVVTKSASQGVVNAGDAITYTIQVTNSGASLAAAVTITDTLPSGVTLIDAGGGSVSGNVITWSVPGIDVGANVSLTVQVRAPVTGGVLTNVAAAVAGSGDANLSNNRATAAVTVTPVANLVVSKFAAPAIVGPGQEITYTVRVRNLGPSPANGVQVRDTLPANAAFVPNSAGPGATLSGNVLSWPAIATLNAGDSATFGLRVTAPPSGTVTNVAAATSAVSDPDMANNRATVTSTVSQADLEISKNGPGNINAGDTIVYDITVRNLGPSSATGVQVRDSLPAGTTFIDANPGVTPSGGVLTWPTFDLANGATATYTVRVSAPTTGTSVTNVARVTSGTSDPDASNNRAHVTTSVTPVANLSLTMSGTGSVNPGQTITYTLNVANNGPSPADAVVLVDTLPAGVTFVSASHGGVHNNGVVTWHLNTLPVGPHAAIDLTLTAPGTAGTITNIARVNASTVDPVPGNNRATFNTTITVANLGITKSGPATALVSAQASYTINVSNAGPAAAQNVVVTDTMPAGVTHVSSTPSPSNVSGNVVTWNLGTLANGGAASIDVTLQMPGTPGPITNVAAVRSSTTDQTPGNNVGSAQTTVLPAANLSVTSSVAPGSPSAGDVVTYTINVTNNGPSPATNVVVIDSLPATGTLVGFSFGVPPVGRQITATISTLNAGANQTYTIDWQVGNAGAHTNSVNVSSPVHDPNPNNNSASSSVTVAPANLAVGISAPAAVIGEQNFDYTITLSNSGPGRAVDVDLTSTFTNADFVSATGGGTESQHTVTFPKIPVLDAGDDTTFTVTLTAPFLGSVDLTANATAATTDNAPGNNTANASITVNPPPADVQVSLTASASSVVVGDSISYTLTVTNVGPGGGSDMKVELDLGPYVSNRSASPPPDQISANVLTWGPNLFLDFPGSSTYTVTVTADTAGATVTATARVTLLNDPDTTNNTVTAVTAISSSQPSLQLEPEGATGPALASAAHGMRTGYQYGTDQRSGGSPHQLELALRRRWSVRKK